MLAAALPCHHLVDRVHSLLHTGLQIAASIWQLTTGWLKQSQILHLTGQPTDGDHPSLLVSHWQHSGLLRELGLLSYTRWRLWLRFDSRSAVDDVTIIDHFGKWSRQALDRACHRAKVLVRACWNFTASSKMVWRVKRPWGRLIVVIASKWLILYDDLLKIRTWNKCVVVVICSVRMSALREQLIADGEYFKRMLNMIPGGYCVNNAENTVSETHSHRNTGGM